VKTASEMTVIVSGGALNSISSVLLPVVYWCLHSVFMCVTLVMLVHYWLLLCCGLYICCIVKNRCFEKSQLVPAGNPMICHHALPKAHLNAVQCCKDADFCNRQAPPTLAPPPSTVATGDAHIMFLMLTTE